jgi:cytoskeletal protein CcmA (bactofilin family)
VGLLTRIFGNREDGAADTGEVSDVTIDGDEMLEPDDRASSERPGVPAGTLDAPSNGQPIPVSDTPRNRHTGANASDGATGKASPRGTARGTAVDAAGRVGTPSTATPSRSEAENEDSEEIDVSDQLEEVDDMDTADTLDAFDDLILEDEDDEETSTSVSIRAAGAVGDEATTVQVAPPEALASAMNLTSETTHHGMDEALVRDSSESTAQSLGSVLSETPEPDPERMRMPSEMKTPKQTLVEAGTEFKGTLKSSCPVVVNGTIDGDIDAPTLNIALTGAILGTVKAKTLRSQGTLSGNVEAEEVFLSGAIRSKTVIKTRRLEVKIGSSDRGQLEVTFGNCDLEVEDALSEPESGVASLSSAESESESDPFSSSGWDSPEIAPGSGGPAAASSARSTSKSSRRNEGPGDDTKKTLR